MLVIDLRHVGELAAPVDVMRVLFQSADALRNSQFKRVVLAYKGQDKFYLEGSFFQTLGREYETQNPAYSLRTFPENVKRLDGTPAYGTWTGGWLGVMSKQMEDLAKFGKDWYMSAP